MSGLEPIGPNPDIPAMAAQIRYAWQTAVNSILMTGVLMHQARMGLNKDQWRALLALLPFSIRWVQMLIAIGADPRLRKHASFLPSDAYTLYQLTRLSDARFDDLIDTGEIHPTMRRAAASAETRAERRAADEARVATLVPAPGTHRTLGVDPAGGDTTPQEKAGRCSGSRGHARAASRRPAPAITTPAGSAKIGLVQPNSWIDLTKLRICAGGCRRGLRGST